MKTRYEYIYFEDEEVANRKTKVFACNNRSSHVTLGYVAWHNGWHQYCFNPNEGMVFSSGCLQDICHFIKQLMDERKK